MHRLIAASPLLLWLTGCASVQSTFNTHGPASNQIAHLSWLMTILFLAVTAVMWVLLGWGFARRRGTLAEHAPIDSGGGQAWIAIGGLAVPLVILSLIFVLGLRLLMRFPLDGGKGGNASTAMQHPDIEIIGHQWWWEVHYLTGQPYQHFVVANEIHIPTGRPINIELATADVMHSFWIPALHGKVDLIPGHVNFVRIEASQPGSYPGQCAEFCGEQHAHMRLLLVAQAPQDYDAWAQQQVKPAMPPTTSEARAGEQIFLNGPCSMCHRVSGTLAGGSVAPDLTHLAGRRFIAANSFPNNTAYLEAWITHAQSLKPGAQMPNLTQFTGVQLRELVAYLQQLH